jgi:ribonuclease Z
VSDRELPTQFKVRPEAFPTGLPGFIPVTVMLQKGLIVDCVLLGSGGMMPMPNRFLTSVAVRFQGQLYLFDAGEGCQINLKKAKLGIKPLRVLAVSHLHGDHCLGVPGLMMMRAQVPDAGPLTILGPPGIERFVRQIRDSLDFFLDYPVTFVEWKEGGPELAYEDDLVRILWGPLKHTTLCLGYRLEEHPRPGRFRKEEATALGVPSGPLWGKLQRGETVTLEKGETITPEQVLGPARPGRRICYAVDTQPNKMLYRLCEDVDMAFLDGMFLPEHREEAEAKGHMTADDAARVSARAGARRAVLVHISPRYTEEDMGEFADAAKERFENAEIGTDLQQFTIPPRE